MKKTIDKIEEVLKSEFENSNELNKIMEDIGEILQKHNRNIITVKDLNGKKFFIPDYQRAYRWGNDEINKLIKDIMECKKNSYFIQPIIYREYKDGKELIIDGQQRLTSLFIILKVLESLSNKKLPNYVIEYETRKEAENFLKNIMENQNTTDSSIDVFHMNLVRNEAKRIFEENHSIEDIIEKILNTQFIYHKINKEDENKIFQRINIGKIPLTNGELTKALILRRGNKINDNQRNKVAILWDEIERNLHLGNFWYMYNNYSEPMPDTRIDFILQIVANKILEENEIKNINKQNIYWIFEVFEEYVKKYDEEDLWNEILIIYNKLKMWYDNITIYHLLGYILNNDYYDILDIIRIYDNNYTKNDGFLKNYNNKINNKEDFIKFLYDIINYKNKSISVRTKDIPDNYKEMHSDIDWKAETNIFMNNNIQIVCENLNYDKHRKIIEKILLLFNILTFLKDNSNSEKNKKSINRFSFECFKKEQWEIEHIHARNDNTDKKEGNLKLLIESLNDKYEKRLKDIAQKYEYDINTDYKDTQKEKDIFNDFYNNVLLENVKENENDKFEELNDSYRKDTLRNLTLLDSKTNREYQDNVFIIKRHILLLKDKNSFFIPTCTRNVFLKYYTKNIRQIACWSEEDGEDYLNEIIKTIKESPIYNEEKKIK